MEFIVFGILLLLGISNAQIIDYEECDKSIVGAPNFQINEYLGTWHVIQILASGDPQNNCSRFDWSRDDTAGHYIVDNTQVEERRLIEIIKGNVTVASDAKMTIESNNPEDGTPIQIEHWILATDHTTYALVYSCRDIGSGRREVSSWILSRAQVLDPSANDIIDPILVEIGVTRSQYREVQQNDPACFYLPEVDENKPVIFRGQCENITGMPNFSIEQYVGWWHQIESYPTGEAGTCRNSEYTNTDSQIYVIDTVVNNYTAQQDNYTVIATADGQLTRRTPEGTVETWIVLHTDYETYSLLYKCEPEEEGSYRRQRVWSAKHSKSLRLTPESETIMKEIIDRHSVLDSQYYLPDDQTNDGCFYLPQVNEDNNEPIILRGQCNDEIDGMDGFDIQQYLGWWHQIQSYPTGEKGTCHSSDFTATGDQFQVVDTVVNDNNAQQNTYTVTATNKGRLTRRFRGFQETWIVLHTDYINYSLLYKCENFGSFQRIVWSAKHSKSLQLTPDFETIMNTTINSNRDLSRDHYQVDDQTNDGCFYLPEVNNNEPVRLRGQCDEEMVGMRDFDMQRYVNWWHQIESYPTGEVGACRNSDFTGTGDEFQVVDIVVNDNQAQQNTYTVNATYGRLTRSSGETWIVLATDYENYSLLYKCENSGNFHRKVWSVKHSTTGIITPESEAVMNKTIDLTRELDHRFYQTEDQSNDACLYFPNDLTKPVTLRGQCDNTRPVLVSFNATMFSGTWYYTDKYPDEWEVTTCPGITFTKSDIENRTDIQEWHAKNITDVEVDRRTDGYLNRTVLADNAARFTRNLTLRNSEENVQANWTISYYEVLATDYTSYAVTYSCQNLNAFQRRITAWKLSRGRTMPNTVATQINNALYRRPEINETFFLKQDQDERCPSSGFLLTSSVVGILVSGILQLLL